MRSVYWENGKVVLINQALLPKKFELIRTDDIERLAEAIRLLEVRGAPSIGVAAAYGMVLAAYQTNGMTKEEALEHLEKNALLLKATRPTAINLFSMVDKMMDFAKERLAA
ncbi:MAG TPA: S-methyl-5-thioribose-1-phosphate isomerase, partial [Flexilinea sp.]|nr:S-methyl-5-thioribose-1-phosphate isomerase [Flexilinea sp.]